MSGQTPTDPVQSAGPDGPTTAPAPVADPVAPQDPPRDAVEPAPARRKGLDDRGRVKRTRAATAWASAVALAIVTILFVIFIVQNSQSVSIDFLWMSGEISAAAALLTAAVAGAFLVGIPAAVRIGQLRHALRRNA